MVYNFEALRTSIRWNELNKSLTNPSMVICWLIWNVAAEMHSFCWHRNYEMWTGALGAIRHRYFECIWRFLDINISTAVHMFSHWNIECVKRKVQPSCERKIKIEIVSKLVAYIELNFFTRKPVRATAKRHILIETTINMPTGRHSVHIMNSFVSFVGIRISWCKRRVLSIYRTRINVVSWMRRGKKIWLFETESTSKFSMSDYFPFFFSFHFSLARLHETRFRWTTQPYAMRRRQEAAREREREKKSKSKTLN